MIELITTRENLNRAYQQVNRNKGSAGIDGLEVEALATHLQEHGTDYIESMHKGSYQCLRYGE